MGQANVDKFAEASRPRILMRRTYGLFLSLDWLNGTRGCYVSSAEAKVYMHISTPLSTALSEYSF